MAVRTRILVAGAVGLGALLLALWLSLKPQGSSARAADAVAPVRDAPEPPPLAGAADGLSAGSVREEAEPAAPVATELAPSKESKEKKPDLEAREWILFQVRDEQGAPVVGAEIELNGLRSKREPSAHFGWRGDRSLGKTAVDGTLKLAYPVWVNLDDESGQISFDVRHPDYATLKDWGREVSPVIEVTLRRGSVLVISGWIESQDRVVSDVSASFPHNVDISKDDWLPRRDGRLTTTRVPPGSHIVYLAWQSPDRGLCFSDLTEFDLEEGQEVELHLELHPAKTVRGRFGDEVPRPVADGIVVLGVQLHARNPTQSSMLRTFAAAVDEDGTFEIAGALSGEAQIAGMCHGWASRPDEEPSKGSGRRVTPQAIDLRSFEGEFVLAMEPTATLEVAFVGPDGEPAAGVALSAWPNICWRVPTCQTWPGELPWTAKSDATGLARLEDIPAGQHWFGIQDEVFELPLEVPTDRMRSALFPSGETVQRTLKLERQAGR